MQGIPHVFPENDNTRQVYSLSKYLLLHESFPFSMTFTLFELNHLSTSRGYNHNYS